MTPDAEAQAANRAHWDALARVHGQDLYYDAEGDKLLDRSV